MKALRTLLCLFTAAVAALCAPAGAQVVGGATGVLQPADDPPRGVWLPGGRSYLGLNVSRSRPQLACQSTALLCDENGRSTEFFVGTMATNFWGVELGYLNLGQIARGTGEARGEGLSLSLVGKARMGPSVGLFGKVGTAYARPDTSVLGAGAAGQGFGLSFGGGLSFDLSPRLSATLEWDSNDFRFASNGRDPVRSTSLGLQFRY